MSIKKKMEQAIDRDMENATLEDFDLKKAVYINERWDLEKSYPLNIRIKRGILAEAKAIAKEKGIPYQTLLKMYIADGVRKDLKVVT